MTKVERTRPGSKNDYRLTYDNGSQKWTNDKPGDGKGLKSKSGLKDILEDVAAKRSFKKLLILKSNGESLKEEFSNLKRDIGETEAKALMDMIENDLDKAKSLVGSSDYRDYDLLNGLFSRNVNFSKSIIIAANACDRCKVALGYDFGCEWGLREGSSEWKSLKSECDFCTDLGRTAGVADVFKRILRRLGDTEIARNLIEKVNKYLKTRNDRDDLSHSDVGFLYKDVDSGGIVPLSNSKKVDIDWTNHAEYRSELRDIDPNKVNNTLLERLRGKPPVKKKVQYKEPGVGTMVVDVDTTRKPAEVDVITVWASSLLEMAEDLI